MYLEINTTKLSKLCPTAWRSVPILSYRNSKVYDPGKPPNYTRFVWLRWAVSLKWGKVHNPRKPMWLKSRSTNGKWQKK
jgi:hypothetical protein